MGWRSAFCRLLGRFHVRARPPSIFDETVVTEIVADAAAEIARIVQAGQTLSPQELEALRLQMRRLGAWFPEFERSQIERWTTA